MNDKIISTLRPGLLVALTISITGNVSYNTKDLERKHREDDGTERARWETERVVKNAGELKRAEKVRGVARQLINKTCARSRFGLLCPNAWEKDLHANITEARRLAAEFNAKARDTEVGVYAIVGRVAQDDVEAVRAINSEVRNLMREMTEGLKNLDVKRVREAAGRARSVGMMLTEEAGAKVKAAIEAARASARKIAKAGDTISGTVDKEAIKAINNARTAFLDLDMAEILPAKPTTSGRAVDLAPDDGKGLIDSAVDSAKTMKKARQGKLRPGPQFDAGGEAAEANAVPKKPASRVKQSAARKRNVAAKKAGAEAEA